MAACTMFTCFARLPAELRRQIWIEALPEDGPAVYLFSRRWTWTLKRDGEQPPHDLVDRERYVEVCGVPEVVFVSHEARRAVAEWARARGYTMRFREETRGHCIVRPWDPERDVLYVGRDQWHEFYDHDPYLGAPCAMDMAAPIRHLAVPAFTAYYNYEELGGHLFHHMPNLATLSVVWGSVLRPRLSRERPARDPGLPMAGPEHYAAVQPRWELEEVADRDEPVTLASLDRTNATLIYEEGNLDEWMDDIETAVAQTGLPEHLVHRGEMTLTLRAVAAVRR